jgi:hypothetical protein
VLDAVFPVYSPAVCLEFGMGFSSTPYLLGKSRLVVSVEHDRRWYAKTLQGVQARGCVHLPVLWPSPNVFDFAALARGWRFDLVLVDGPVASRVSCVTMCLAQADVLVLHDTDASCYGWEEALKYVEAAGRAHVTVRTRVPWTTVVANDDARFAALLGRLDLAVGEKGQFHAPIRRY